MDETRVREEVDLRCPDKSPVRRDLPRFCTLEANCHTSWADLMIVASSELDENVIYCGF